MFGWALDDLIDQLVDRLVPEHLREAHIEHREGYLANPVTRPMGDLIVTGVRKDGSEFPLEIGLSAINSDEGLFVLSFMTDITRRKQLEAEVARRENLYRTLARNFPGAAVFLFDRDLRFLAAEGGGLEAAGYRREALEGHTLFEVLLPETADQLAPIYRAALDGQRTHFTRKSGDLVFSIEALPVLDEDGAIIAGMLVSMDVTEQTRAEEQRRAFTEKLERSNRELEDFAFVASHDLQEPLRKIHAFGERLAASAGDSLDARSRDYLTRMLNAAGRMQLLIDDLLAYSRITTRGQPFAPVSLTQVAAEVISDLEVSIEQAHGKVEIGRLPTIDADRLQMRQLLQNLIGNALKFHQPDQPPVVHVEQRQAMAGLVEIVVRDEGIGFEQKYADRIFGMFQRLHGRNEYEGTGIGLAICRKIAERHGGTIRAESSPGQGTAFIIRLPASHLREGDH